MNERFLIMALEPQHVLTEEQQAPAEYQEVFQAMDDLRTGEITLEQYREIPKATRRAAKQWRVRQATQWFAERHPDMSLESDI